MKFNLQSSPLELSRQKLKQKLPGLSKKLYKDYNGSLKKINHHKEYNSLFPKLILKNKQFSFQINCNKKSDLALQKSFNSSINPHHPKQNANHCSSIVSNSNTNLANPIPSHPNRQQNNKRPGNIKKRQKLHTQGISESYETQQENIDQSFISLTNHVINQQLTQQNSLLQEDNTMINFRKKIEQNKIIIKQQIQKKNKQNQSISKRQLSFIKKKRISSQKIIQHSPEEEGGSSKLIVQKQKKTIDSEIRPTLPSNRANTNQNKKQQKKQIFYQINGKSRKPMIKQRERQQKTEISINKNNSMHLQKPILSEKKLDSPTHQGLFSNLQVILEDKMKPEGDKAKFEDKKLKSLLEKLNKLKKDKNYSSFQQHGSPLTLSDDLLTSSFKKLKRQTNYYDWNKLDFSSTSEVTYRKSSFEDQLRKISEYTDRNDASLQKYLHTRKQLLKYGFQVYNGQKKSK